MKIFGAGKLDSLAYRTVLLMWS